MVLDLIEKDFFSIGNEIGKNVIIFGVDVSASTKIYNRKKDILGLEHTLSAEKLYSFNFTKKNTKFCLSLHYNGTNSYFLLTVQRLLNLKQQTLKLMYIHYA